MDLKLQRRTTGLHHSSQLFNNQIHLWSCFLSPNEWTSNNPFMSRDFSLEVWMGVKLLACVEYWQQIISQCFSSVPLLVTSPAAVVSACFFRYNLNHLDRQLKNGSALYYRWLKTTTSQRIIAMLQFPIALWSIFRSLYLFLAALKFIFFSHCRSSHQHLSSC